MKAVEARHGAGSSCCGGSRTGAEGRCGSPVVAAAAAAETVAAASAVAGLARKSDWSDAAAADKLCGCWCLSGGLVLQEETYTGACDGAWHCLQEIS